MYQSASFSSASPIQVSHIAQLYIIAIKPFCAKMVDQVCLATNVYCYSFRLHVLIYPNIFPNRQCETFSTDNVVHTTDTFLLRELIQNRTIPIVELTFSCIINTDQ